MILPASLSPLPALPRGDDPENATRVEIEDFVSAVQVRAVLLGTAGELPVEGLAADDAGSFAGRADVEIPSCLPFVAARPSGLLVPDLAVEARVVHPAFEASPVVIRRAAPPRVVPVDREAGFGVPGLSERWWVAGMGLAATVILFSGTLVDFASREAARRSGDTMVEVIHVTPSEPRQSVEPQKGTAIVAKFGQKDIE